MILPGSKLVYTWPAANGSSKKQVELGITFSLSIDAKNGLSMQAGLD